MIHKINASFLIKISHETLIASVKFNHPDFIDYF